MEKWDPNRGMPIMVQAEAVHVIEEPFTSTGAWDGGQGEQTQRHGEREAPIYGGQGGQGAPQTYEGAPQAHSQTPLFNNEAGARAFLSEHDIPLGLQDAFVSSMAKLPKRFFIVDDSGSMSINDGNRLISAGPKSKMMQCSRWSELTDMVKFHVSLARQAGAPSEFRLLNSVHPIRLGYDYQSEGDAFRTLTGILSGSPGGGTPLCRHIREVIEEVRGAEHALRSRGQKVALIIATDGQASDGSVAEAMRPLKNLPVLVILRLCTDQEEVVRYWAEIDQELELHMDVLDDFAGEAREIHKVNPWLTYGVQMQRLREFGVPVKEFDLLDERQMSFDEIHRVIWHIYGGSLEDYPHPATDMRGLKALLAPQHAKTWCSIARKEQPWVNLDRAGSQACTVC